MNVGIFSGVLGATPSDPVSIRNRVSNRATNLSVLDRGGSVRKTDTGAYTYAIRPDVIEGWNDDAAILVANDGSSGDLTVAGQGTVVITAGTTVGAVTIPPGDSRLLSRVGVDSWRAR
jgi:hypothetical protein